MKLDFALSTRRNLLAAFLNRCLLLVFPFLNRTLFLWLLGPAYLGLNGLFQSILGMLSLAELGFGMAIDCSMYKAVAEDDRDLVCAYLHFYRTAYRWVGTAILVVGLCLLPFLRHLVHGELPPGIDLHILYLIHLANVTVSYFLFAYRRSILGAFNRKDVLANISTVTTIAQYLTVFVVLLVTRNYYLYVVTTVVFTVVLNALAFWQSRRLFPDIVPRGDLPESNRRQVILDVKSIFMHKIGSAVSFSFDNLVVSVSLGLVAVAAYGNYFYVYTAVSGLVGVMGYSMMSGFGNKIHTEGLEENFKLFMRANRLVGIVVMWCAAMMMSLYQPFIQVWTRGDPVLCRHLLTPILMVAFFYVSQSRLVFHTFKSAAALWHQDRWKAVVSAIVNLALNISFVLLLPEDYKLDGVILSTIIAFLVVEYPWESRVMFDGFFGQDKARPYWYFQASFAAFALLLCIATWDVVRAVSIDGLPGLLVKAMVAALYSGIMVLFVFRSDVRSLVSTLRTMGKR